ncbi:hypothetical protein F5H01DRAFT_343394 [Linnemannia elongata]|nr:hypothetical protein F5H01DRAFT_343394 [Linnemannia elongata]
MTSSTSPPSITSPSPSPAQASPPITLNIRASKGNTYPITLSLTDTVLHLKEQVALASNTASDRIRLVFSGRVLKDTYSIESCKLAHGNVVHMVRSPAAATKTTPAMALASAAVGVQTSIPFNSSPALSVSAPFANPDSRQQPAGTFGTRTGFTSTTPTSPSSTTTHPTNTQTGFPYGVGNGQGGQGMEGADMMGQMMQDPTFAQFMSSMLQNPQILESMVATNPMLQAMLGPDMRHILQSPQFRQMVASPDALRQVAQMGTPMSSSGSNLGARSTSPINATAASPPTTVPSPTMMSHGMAGMRLPSSLIAVNAPEKRFQVQLQQLSEMGFWDPTKNIRALQVTGGDVNSAIEILCSGV